MDIHIEWEALEFREKKKSADWYWAIGVIFITGALVSFIFNNIIFGIFLLLSGFALALHSALKPNIVYYAITEKGLVIGERMHLWKDLDSFWIIVNQNRENLEENETSVIFKSRKSLSPFISIPIHEKMNLEEMRERLIKFIPEEEHRIPFSQIIVDKFGF